MLDDGTAGMQSIKRTGRITMVQDPGEAEYPDMPKSVLVNVEVDHVLSIQKMGEQVGKIIYQTVPRIQEVPEDIIHETRLDQRVSTRIDELARLERSEHSCPECYGGLWITQKEEPVRFRCHIGHKFSEKELLLRVSEVMENTLWTSLRMMEERRSLSIIYCLGSFFSSKL
jgi:two-component system chemotaxis response regulator CheB